VLISVNCLIIQEKSIFLQCQHTWSAW